MPPGGSGRGSERRRVPSASPISSRLNGSSPHGSPADPAPASGRGAKRSSGASSAGGLKTTRDQAPADRLNAPIVRQRSPAQPDSAQGRAEAGGERSRTQAAGRVQSAEGAVARWPGGSGSARSNSAAR